MTLTKDNFYWGFKESIRYRRLFKKYNNLYFYDSIPQTLVGIAPLLKIEYIEGKAKNNLKKVSGGDYAIANYFEDGSPYIVLDRGITQFHVVLAKQSLLHEMIHLALGTSTHGTRFKTQIRRIASLGALDNLI